MDSVREEILDDEPYALKFPDDVYTKEEQGHIWVINELRKDLEAEKIQHGRLSNRKDKQLNAYRWVLRLIDEISDDDESA